MLGDRKKMLSRYSFIVVIVALCGIAIVVRICYTMYIKNDFWNHVASNLKRYDIPVEPFRGNIISSDGKLLASSLPEYRLYIDMMAGGFKDTLITNHVNEITSDLHAVFPDKSKRYFHDLLMQGLKKKKRNRNLLLYPNRVSFIELKELKSKRYFSMNPNVSGFHYDEINNRKRPFGSLAERTIGDISQDKSVGAKYGIELAYDSVLRGKAGHKHREKVKSGYIDIIDVPAVNGMDIVTTIDVEMQDIVESTLKDKLVDLGAESGIAMLMEVGTGDIKAIVNLGRVRDSIYTEVRSYALSDLMEPGSTFKTASVMVALEDGAISMDDFVDTGNGVKKMHGVEMKDHNWKRGGYGIIDLQQIMMYSSNIGVSQLIDTQYYGNPQKFVDGLKQTGIFHDWKFPLKEYLPPRHKQPGTPAWDATTLAWMSIGYNSQLSMLNMLAFYNAIANNGKLVSPRIVKAFEQDGVMVEEFPVEVVKEQICSPETLEKIHFLLEKVVTDGLGKDAGNDKFPVAGKTGTAIIAENGHYGDKNFASFAGYFPSVDPMYTCVVAITKKGLIYGHDSADAFGRIAEQVYAKHIYSGIESVIDYNTVSKPQIMRGNLSMASQVAAHLGLEIVEQEAGTVNDSMEWGIARLTDGKLDVTRVEMAGGRVPNVIGMGAMDAVYLMESAGIGVSLSGFGKVVSQSLQPGSRITKGAKVRLHLE